MRIIVLTNDTIFFDIVKKSLYVDLIKVDEKGMDEFAFSKSDVVVFDVDRLKDLLHLVVFKTKVFCLTRELDEMAGYELLKLGVSGYDVLGSNSLQEAIRVIKNGDTWINAKVMSFIIKNSTIDISKKHASIQTLSKQELKVAKLVSQSLSNQQIADSLNITIRTVKAHIGSSFAKLNIKDRVELAMYVKECGE